MMAPVASRAYPGDTAVRCWEVDMLVTAEQFRRQGMAHAMLNRIESVVRCTFSVIRFALTHCL